MIAKPARVVFAFYSSKDEEPDRAFRALRAIGRSGLSLLRAEGSVLGAPVEARYAALRLEGESAIIARTKGSSVQAVVKQLRLTGSPAIFALHPDIERLTTPRETSGKPQNHKSSILTRLKEDQLILDASRSELLEAAQLDHALTAAAEWITDNV